MSETQSEPAALRKAVIPSTSPSVSMASWTPVAPLVTVPASEGDLEPSDGSAGGSAPVSTGVVASPSPPPTSEGLLLGAGGGSGRGGSAGDGTPPSG